MLFIYLLLMMVLPSVVAQDLGVVIHTDQQVYISGEGVWLDGSVSGAELPRYIQIQLLDRKGQAAAKLKLLLNGGRFSGYCELPGNLRSDYYFFDAFSSGRAVQTELAPVMIINPLMPPVVCTVPESQGITHQVSAAAGVPVLLDKTQYRTREKVAVNLPELDSAAEISVNIIRKDRLSEYADSVILVNQRVFKHPNIGLKETEGHHFLVNVKQSNGTPKAGVRVFAAILGDQAKISTGQTDKNGELEGIIPLVYGDTKIVFSLGAGSDSSLRIELMDNTLPEQPVDFPCLILDSNWRSDIENRLLNVKVNRTYDMQLKRRYLLDNADTTDFYGRPDAHYNLDDYTRFPDMKEILLEFVPEARIRNGEGPAPVIEILDAPRKGFFDQNGWILLDGIPVRDMHQLLSLNPLLLQSVEVVSRKYFLGSLAVDGILQYKSYKSDLAGYALPVQDIIYPFQGIQIPAMPEFPQYLKDSGSHFPDFRNLLFRLSPGNFHSGIFCYTSDATGDYQVIVSGHNAKGQPILSKASFQVKE